MSVERVAVVGMSNSGKTVFLTSLVNHLTRHDERLLPLGDGRIRVAWEPLGSQPRPTFLSVDGLEMFPYAESREALHRREWPPKTREVTGIGLNLSIPRTGVRKLAGGRRHLRLEFIDFPGERLGDMTMAGQDYEEWSDAVLQFITRTPEYAGLARPFMDCCRTQADEATILQAYRETLARFAYNYLPFVTPSSFTLGANRSLRLADPARPDLGPAPAAGSVPSMGVRINPDVGALAAERIVGLTFEAQFCPLPAGLRESRRELAKAFAERYRDYRRHVADDLARRFRSCNHLVVLLDLTTFLAGGVGTFNGCRQMLKLLMAYAEPGVPSGMSGLDQLLAWLSWGRFQLNPIRRLSLVATKADKAHEADRGNLTALMGDMADMLVEPYVRRNKLQIRYYACSAVDSTRSYPDMTLAGRWAVEGEGFSPEPVKLRASRVPDRWPDQWAAGQYHFPDCAPEPPENSGAAPRHIGLAPLCDFILGLS